MAKTKIKKIHGRKSWGLDGKPAFEIDVILRYGAQGRVTIPCPNLMSQNVEDLDQVLRFINNDLHNLFKGISAVDQSACDQVLSELETLPEAPPIAPNLFKALSHACLLAASDTEKLPLWQYLGTYLGLSSSDTLPLPLTDMITLPPKPNSASRVGALSLVPLGATSFFEALNWSQRVHNVTLMSELSSGLNDVQALEHLTGAIETARLRPGEDMAIALRIKDIPINETGRYVFEGQEQAMSSDNLSGQLVDWVSQFPIVSIENPFAAHDLEAYKRLNWAIGKRTQVIAPDRLGQKPLEFSGQNTGTTGNALLLVSNEGQMVSDMEALKLFADERAMSSILDVNAGGLSGALALHLAVGWGVCQIKTGQPSDPVSMMVWREGMRIAEAISETDGGRSPLDGNLPDRSSFVWG